MKKTSRAQVGDIIKVPQRDFDYVVERAEMQGGGIGHTPADSYPDGHHVTARRLNDDMTYSSDNPFIEFYQSGEFDPAQVLIVPTVEVIGHMTRTFLPEVMPTVAMVEEAPALTEPPVPELPLEVETVTEAPALTVVEPEAKPEPPELTVVEPEDKSPMASEVLSSGTIVLDDTAKPQTLTAVDSDADQGTTVVTSLADIKLPTEPDADVTEGGEDSPIE